MSNIDPSSAVGMLRLRVADFSDLPFLPDSVYVQTLADANGSMPVAAKTIAMYILGMLSQKTHKKMVSLEVWGAEAFTNYKSFLLLTFKDPAFMPSIVITPYAGSTTIDGEINPLIQFQRDWNKAYSGMTQSQVLHQIAESDGL